MPLLIVKSSEVRSNLLTSKTYDNYYQPDFSFSFFLLILRVFKNRQSKHLLQTKTKLKAILISSLSPSLEYLFILGGGIQSRPSLKRWDGHGKKNWQLPVSTSILGVNFLSKFLDILFKLTSTFPFTDKSQEIIGHNLRTLSTINLSNRKQYCYVCFVLYHSMADGQQINTLWCNNNVQKLISIYRHKFHPRFSHNDFLCSICSQCALREKYILISHAWHWW